MVIHIYIYFHLELEQHFEVYHLIYCLFNWQHHHENQWT